MQMTDCVPAQLEHLSHPCYGVTFALARAQNKCVSVFVCVVCVCDLALASPVIEAKQTMGSARLMLRGKVSLEVASPGRRANSSRFPNSPSLPLPSVYF